MNFKMKKARNWALALAAIAVLTGTAAITRGTDNFFEIAKNLDIFGKVYRELNAWYVDEVDPSKAMRKGIDAMLSDMDPYTVFWGESEIEDARFQNDQEFGAVAAQITRREGRFIVLEPYQPLPDQPGLQAGDEILKIDDAQIAGAKRTLEDVRNLMRGEKGSAARLTILRPGEADPIVVSIARDPVKREDVPYYGMLEDGIGYISLIAFNDNAAGEVRAALDALARENTLKGLVLDLRGNPGGRLDQAVDIVNLFVPQNTKVVETRGKDASMNRPYPTRLAPRDLNLPLSCLINGTSASASEIVSGALQDLDRAVVVGQQSYGKGLVQNIRPLSFNTQMKITTAKYYTPSGRCIQAIDYTLRRKAGGAGMVPDSLRNSFSTTTGRSVRDGGGIEPDLPIQKPEQPTVIKELERQGIIFDFATQYKLKHPSIAAAKDFQPGAQDFEAFVAFAQSRNFSYKSQAEEELANLKKAMEKEGYSEGAASALQAMEKQLTTLKAGDLRAQQQAILRLIRQEIVQRYYGRAGAIEAAFRDDPEVSAAVSVLKDPASYKKILNR